MSLLTDDEETQAWQIGLATAGTIAGALLGCITSYLFFPSMTAWLQSKGMSERYKYFFGTIIVLLSMPIPGFIGYVGGTDTASIYPNMLYFCILYVAMILLFEDLMIPGFFDSIILAGLVYSCFYLSMKYGLKDDGTLSLWWFPMIIIFSLLLTIYYYFADITKLISNGERLWKNPEISNKEESNATHKKPWLIPDFKEYNHLIEKLLEFFNSKTYPQFNSEVKKGEDVIDSELFEFRPIVPVVMLCIWGLSFVVTLIMQELGTTPIDFGIDIKLQTGLKFSAMLAVFCCAFLLIEKWIINWLMPPEFNEINLNKIVATKDPNAFKTLIPKEVKSEVQFGGGKIESHKPRKSKSDEKYLRVSI